MFEKLKERIRFIKWAYANRDAKVNAVQLKTEQLQLNDIHVRFCIGKADIERLPQEFIKRRMAELAGKEIVDRFSFYYVDEDNGAVLVCLDLLVAKR